MKLGLRLLTVLMTAALFVVAGCSKEPAQPTQAEVDRDEMLRTVQQTSQQLGASLDALAQQNDDMRFTLRDQQRQIEEVRLQLRQMQEAAGLVQQRIADERAAAEANKGKGLGFFEIVIAIIVVIILVYFIYRLLAPKPPFEDEDEDDFSSFDDEFGFEDEEEEDFFEEGSDEKKKGKNDEEK